MIDHIWYLWQLKNGVNNIPPDYLDKQPGNYRTAATVTTRRPSPSRPLPVEYCWKRKIDEGEQSVRALGKQEQGKNCLAGIPHSLERCRPQHPDPRTGQGGIRQAAVVAFSFQHLPSRCYNYSFK